MSDTLPLLGAIEAGGTKFVCAIGTGPDDVRALERFPTTTPEETLCRAVAFFEAQPEAPAALGIGSFGPVDVRAGSPTYGYVTQTPKKGWSNTDLVGYLGRALNVPCGFDTDVNAAALGEGRWGAAQALDTFVYVTVGTGIGGGAVIGGAPLHGLVHPEMGHIRVPRAQDDVFAGTCPFHGDCLEGLASGPSIEARWGQPGHMLPSGHDAWRMEAHYLASLAAHLVLLLSPERIIFGGGVMEQAHLFDRVRAETQALLGQYVQAPALLSAIDTFIVAPALGDRAGVLGAMVLAERVLAAA